MGRIKTVEAVNQTGRTKDSTHKGKSQRGSGFDNARSFREKLREECLKREKSMEKEKTTGKNEDRITISAESMRLYEEKQRKKVVNDSDKENSK